MVQLWQIHQALLNVHQSSTFEGSEIYTAETCLLEIELAIEKLKKKL
jgi:hypothetical protein